MTQRETKKKGFLLPSALIKKVQGTIYLVTVKLRTNDITHCLKHSCGGTFF